MKCSVQLRLVCPLLVFGLVLHVFYSFLVIVYTIIVSVDCIFITVLPLLFMYLLTGCAIIIIQLHSHMALVVVLFTLVD